MKHALTVNCSVQGASHLKKKIPMQDCSGRYEDPEGRYYIIAAADGHGAAECVRSQYGSSFAVDTALRCLQSFAEQLLKEVARVPEEGGRTLDRLRKVASEHRAGRQIMEIRRITDRILYEWRNAVGRDLQDRPLSTEELELSGVYREAHEAGKRLEHLYGTTLIAALIVEDLLIMLHQGDGRCDVFYEDGSVDQPIPWDERCEQNITTSLCDPDAADSIRHKIIDLRSCGAGAVWLASDGVEDSYPSMEGTHVFFRTRTLELAEQTGQEFEEHMKEVLLQLSIHGSGDDVTIAGIVDTEWIENVRTCFEQRNRLYILQDQKQVCEDRLVSMQRKYEALKRRAEDAEEKLRRQMKTLQELRDERRELLRKHEDTKHILDLLERQYSDLKEREGSLESNIPSVTQIGQHMDQYLYSQIFLSGSFFPKVSKMLKGGDTEIFKDAFRRLNIGAFISSDLSEQCRSVLRGPLTERDRQLQSQKKVFQQEIKALEVLDAEEAECREKIEALKNAQKEFEEYDALHQEIEQKLADIEKEFHELEITSAAAVSAVTEREEAENLHELSEPAERDEAEDPDEISEPAAGEEAGKQKISEMNDPAREEPADGEPEAIDAVQTSGLFDSEIMIVLEEYKLNG